MTPFLILTGYHITYSLPKSRKNDAAITMTSKIKKANTTSSQRCDGLIIGLLLMLMAYLRL
jgi:hypothetical protein